MTELMWLQVKSVLVMMGCGILTEIIWEIKKRLKYLAASIYFRGIIELTFWLMAFYTISMFIYYSTYGQITLYGSGGFLAGLLLWKKIHCGIIKTVWVEKEEVRNSKTKAKSSILMRQENNDWKREGRKENDKKLK